MLKIKSKLIGMELKALLRERAEGLSQATLHLAAHGERLAELLLRRGYLLVQCRS